MQKKGNCIYVMHKLNYEKKERTKLYYLVWISPENTENNRCHKKEKYKLIST
jgi:hypothetical protein